MNFSIVMPGGCNGKCSFCFWKERDVCDSYLESVRSVLKNLPTGLNLSITGGEPTISPVFGEMLAIIKEFKAKFEKVILTTNGSYLHRWLDDFEGAVDHINVSRHHFDEMVRKEIFGADLAPDSYLRPIIEKLNQQGIDVTFNAVLCGRIASYNDVIEFISYAKKMGASSLCFRRDYGEGGGVAIGAVEQLFENYKSTYDYNCPVCRTKVQLINGFKVIWKASTYEPSVDLNDIYELILQPTGKITIDWAAEHEVVLSNGTVIAGSPIAHKYIQRPEKKKRRSTGIAVEEFSGCGISTRNYNSCGIDTRSHGGCGTLVTSKYSGC